MVKKGDKKRLAFLREFMAENNIKGVDATKILGIPARTWEDYIARDSMMLSAVQKILATKGCKLEIKYGKNEKLREENLPNSCYYRRPCNESEEMKFLNSTLEYHLVSLRNLTKLGVHIRTLYRCNQIGDIKISLVYKISETLDIPVSFNIVKIKKTKARSKLPETENPV